LISGRTSRGSLTVLSRTGFGAMPASRAPSRTSRVSCGSTRGRDPPPRAHRPARRHRRR
jgi:hypothetical protein